MFQFLDLKQQLRESPKIPRRSKLQRKREQYDLWIVSLQQNRDKCRHIFNFQRSKHFQHQLRCTCNSDLDILQLNLRHVTRPFCLFDLSHHSLLQRKKRKITANHHPFWKSSMAQSKEAALWKGTWPLAPQRRPGSEQRATVVITEGLIADRTFQQPVVNWMEQRGRILQMHNPDRCSADDFYFMRGQFVSFSAPPKMIITTFLQPVLFKLFGGLMERIQLRCEQMTL